MTEDPEYANMMDVDERPIHELPDHNNTPNTKFKLLVSSGHVLRSSTVSHTTTTRREASSSSHISYEESTSVQLLSPSQDLEIISGFSTPVQKKFVFFPKILKDNIKFWEICFFYVMYTENRANVNVHRNQHRLRVPLRSRSVRVCHLTNRNVLR